MVDPQGPSEIPKKDLPDPVKETSDGVTGETERDPILEELLKPKSKSGENSSKNTKSKKKAALKTGTSLDKKSKKSKLPLVAAITASALIFGGGGTALWLNMNSDNTQIEADKNDNKTKPIDKKSEEDSIEDEKDAPWNTEEGVFPIELKEWQKGTGKEGLSEKEEQELLESLSGSDLSVSASILPAEAAGFTSDDSKILDENGSLNPLYSFWTQESFTSETGQIIEKFLNPRFGEWEDYQGEGSDPNSIDPASLFPNTFTNELLESGEPVSKWLPIHADWSNNDYGRDDLSSTGPRWYGSLQSSNAEFTWDEESSQYTVDFTGDVEFTAYASNGEKLSENGVLTLELVANSDREKGSGGKVLVNRSSLTIGG